MAVLSHLNFPNHYRVGFWLFFVVCFFLQMEKECGKENEWPTWFLDEQGMGFLCGGDVITPYVGDIF